MPSADQVPVKSPHSTMHWHMWVVLIAGSTGSALRAVRPPNLHITPDESQRDLVTNHGQRAGGEQTTQVAIALLASSSRTAMASRLSARTRAAHGFTNGL